MSEATAVLAALAAIYLAACVSPGPNWFIIGELALSRRHRDAYRAALGIALGSTSWATLSIAGVATVLQGQPQLAFLWRTAGAAYLVWCGVAMWRRAGVSIRPAAGADGAPGIPGHAFRTGLFTSLTNPKAGLFWTSVFAANMPGEAPAWLACGIVAMVATMSGIFHVGLARLLRAVPVQGTHDRHGPWIRRCSGLFLALVGLRLLVPA